MDLFENGVFCIAAIWGAVPAWKRMGYTPKFSLQQVHPTDHHLNSHVSSQIAVAVAKMNEHEVLNMVKRSKSWCTSFFVHQPMPINRRWGETTWSRMPLRFWSWQGEGAMDERIYGMPFPVGVVQNTKDSTTLNDLWPMCVIFELAMIQMLPGSRDPWLLVGLQSFKKSSLIIALCIINDLVIYCVFFCYNVTSRCIQIV